MRDGTIVNRSGRKYKPSTIRSYETCLTLHILPELGGLKLAQVDRARVRSLVRKWIGAGQASSTVRNSLDPLRVIFREALEVGEITVDPTVKLTLPQGATVASGLRTAPRRRGCSRRSGGTEGDLELCVLRGLRRGELRALKWSDVDLEAGAIRVSRTWDDKEGHVATKSEAGIGRCRSLGRCGGCSWRTSWRVAAAARIWCSGARR